MTANYWLSRAQLPKAFDSTDHTALPLRGNFRVAPNPRGFSATHIVVRHVRFQQFPRVPPRLCRGDLETTRRLVRLSNIVKTRTTSTETNAMYVCSIRYEALDIPQALVTFSLIGYLANPSGASAELLQSLMKLV